MKILNDLKNMFGFLDEDLDWQKIDNDGKETDEKMAISEVATKKITEVNCNPIKNEYKNRYTHYVFINNIFITCQIFEKH